MTPVTLHPRPMALALAVLAAAGTSAALVPGAQAQQPPLQPNAWSVRLGAGMVVNPAYPGSESIQIMPVPMLDIAYRPALPLLDTVFLNMPDGLGVIAYRGGPFSIGASVGLALGRDQDVAARLHGMGDIESAARASAFVRADFGRFGLSLQVNRALGDQEGTTLALGATLRQPIGDRLMLMGRVEAIWADGDSMQQWFGVTAQQARRSRFAAYDAGSGLRSVGATLTGIYRLSDNWSLNATIGVSQLLGDAADSPITQRATQPFGMLGIGYRF